MMENRQPLLSIHELQICYPSDNGLIKAVNKVSFVIPTGITVGLVGESGSGKSTLGQAIPGLLPPGGKISGGALNFTTPQGQVDLAALPPEKLHHYRGGDIAMIFQDALSCLDPVLSIGAQLQETVAALQPKRDRKSRRQRCLQLLQQVGFPFPAPILKMYPHQLSGGMRQRVLIALALAGNPRLLIADEPTTALDVTTQKQILTLLAFLQKELNLSILLISHDLAVISSLAKQVTVLYAGKIVEQGPVRAVFTQPAHPYTKALLQARPKPGAGLPQALPGQAPEPLNLPDRCYFYPRCPHQSA
ncbi:MAG: ABC transporter ATP-binding protein, partial [Clostridiales bacterium]